MYKEKILSLEKLSAMRKCWKEDGKKVVLCHGCFDLFHPGHLKHLEAAKRMGDILVVTITADKYVNKGPFRPVFNERLRAETIASLYIVDYVGISRFPTAVEVIKLIKPDFYVKGIEYRDAEKDVTQNIRKEEEAVRSAGGKLMFTDEITFSSTYLLNKFFPIVPEESCGFLTEFKKQYSCEKVISLLDSLKELNVLVVGDTIIDEYTYCKAMGAAIKAPTISARRIRTEKYHGGALAVARHLSSFVKNVEVVTCIGGEDEMFRFVMELESAGLHVHATVNPNSPTTVKQRFLEEFNNQKIFEVSVLDDRSIPLDVERQIMNDIKTYFRDKDLLIISDFGHGMITERIVRQINSLRIFKSATAQTNSANYGFNLITKYNGCEYVSIDERELRLATCNKEEKIEHLVPLLAKRCNFKMVSITMGKDGCILYNHDTFWRIPGFSTAVVDTVGAGDAFLAITSAMACKGLSPEVIGFVGNCVGNLAVKIIGNKESVRYSDTVKFIRGLLG